MPIILTGMSPEEFALDKIRGNLVDLAKEAGYSTAWVDNQDIQTATAVGMSATHTTNPIDLHADSMGRHTLDEVLLPAIQRESARGLSVPATVMFVSDHGEDLQLLDGTAGHGAPAYTDHAFDIPAFVWVNRDYRARYPARVHALESNAAKVFRSHNVFETERSLVSEGYVPSTEVRYVAGGNQINKPTATTLSPVPREDSPQRSKSGL